MTNTVSSPTFAVFRSQHFNKDICSTDLSSFNEEQLQILFHEATKVATECLAGCEWAKSSLPNEWPDEDWPRRVRKKASLVGSFAKHVNSEIKRRRQQRHLEALQLKTEALQLKADSLTERYTRMRYIRAALRERFGYEITREVLERAEEIAKSNKPSPTFADGLQAQ